MTNQMSTTTTTTADWAYLLLEIISDDTVEPDLITWKLLINKALSRFLGITGEATTVDILHTKRTRSWIRVPEPQLAHVWSALSGAHLATDSNEVGIRVIKASRSLMAIAGPSRSEDQLL